MAKFSIRKETIIIPVLFILLIWIVFLVQVLFGFRECYGIVPLSFKGLRGIVLAPLFHGSFQHIISNTPPLFVLMVLTFHFYDRLAYFVLVNGWIFSGLVVWLLPDFTFMNSSLLSCHIGASGIIYMLAFFLFFSGIFRKEKALMVVSLIVVFLYGSIVWGMLPQEFFGIFGDNRISWESHFSGALIGAILAFMLRKIGRRKEVPRWKQRSYDPTYDQQLWERYKEEYPEDFQGDKEKIKEELDEVRKKSEFINQYKNLDNKL